MGFVSLGAAFADSNDDFQAVKKAVKDNPQYDPGKEAKWLKVLVTDTRTNKDKVKITLPISLVELFMKCADDRNLRIDRDEYDIDLKELFAELKKVGPMALIEVYEDDELVKIWLE
jgi:Leu/Phe-tRNA-protein transferase